MARSQSPDSANSQFFICFDTHAHLDRNYTAFGRVKSGMEFVDKLKKGNNPHILTLSPPINMDPRWLGPHVAYTISKFNMSMLAIGWAQEFKSAGIASNAIWPKTTIDTAAVRNLLGGQALANMSRTTDIMADAAYYILKQKASECSGNKFSM